MAGRCFKVAGDYAREHPEVRYMEGFALVPSLGGYVSHAWVERDGQALEVTWNQVAEDYFGAYCTPRADGVNRLSEEDFIELRRQLSKELQSVAPEPVHFDWEGAR